LEHDHPYLHWDLFLESGGILRGWRLASPPAPGVEVAAEATFDHRLAYLDYEGPVSGNRGHVTRWDGGIFTWVESVTGRIVARFDGGRLQGMLVLEQVREATWRATLLGGA
jgi:hypothetical protein